MTKGAVSELFTPDPGLPRPDPDLSEHLRQLASGESVDVEAIHEMVCGYVRTLRSAGARPEQMIVAVKAELQKSGVSAARTQKVPVAVDEIVRRCIAEYYRAA